MGAQSIPTDTDTSAEVITRKFSRNRHSSPAAAGRKNILAQNAPLLVFKPSSRRFSLITCLNKIFA